MRIYWGGKVTSGTSFGNLLREILLAIGMIVLLIGGLYAHTGTMPPLVVVESSSMIHSEQGEIGSIDAGDLILVQETSFENIVTFAEATDVTNRNYGYETHGMEGDVIIFKKEEVMFQRLLFTEQFSEWSQMKQAFQTGMHSQAQRLVIR